MRKSRLFSACLMISLLSGCRSALPVAVPNASDAFPGSEISFGEVTWQGVVTEPVPSNAVAAAARDAWLRRSGQPGLPAASTPYSISIILVPATFWHNAREQKSLLCTVRIERRDLYGESRTTLLRITQTDKNARPEDIVYLHTLFLRLFRQIPLEKREEK